MADFHEGFDEGREKTGGRGAIEMLHILSGESPGSLSPITVGGATGLSTSPLFGAVTRLSTSLH